MSRLHPALPAALLVLALAACGGPDAGDDCDGGGFVCASDEEALECNGSTWRSIPCRGAGGCREVSQTVSCDAQGNREGDGCASDHEGSAICTADGKGLLECRQGVLALTSACSTCTKTSDQVTCTP